MRTNMATSGRGAFQGGHVGKSPQLEVPLKIFKAGSSLGFVCCCTAAIVTHAKAIGWHDFSNKPVFIVNLEGFAAWQPPYYDIVRLVPDLLGSLLFLAWRRNGVLGASNVVALGTYLGRLFVVNRSFGSMR